MISSKIEFLKEKVESYKHFKVLTYYIVILLLYNFYEKATIPKYFMYSKIDDYIPFVKFMIVPYLFWYIYIIIALAYLGIKSRKDFLSFTTFMFSGMTICFIFYAIFPNGQNLRPIIVHNDIFSKMIDYIYMMDTPTNSAPSMHVVNAIAVHIALTHYDGLKDVFRVKVISLITMLLIIASTVMVKQHSILDVLYAIGLSVCLYLIIYKFSIIDKLSDKFSFNNNENF